MVFLLIPWYLERESSCCLGNNFSTGLGLVTLGTSSVPTCVEGCEPHRGTSQKGGKGYVYFRRKRAAFSSNSSLACKSWRPMMYCSQGLGMSELVGS